MAIVDDIAAALTTAGFTNLVARVFTEAAPSQICIIPGGGSSEIITGGDLEKPTVQIQARAEDMLEAENTIYAIKGLLHKNSNVANTAFMVWDGREPWYWQDPNHRHVFAIEFTAVRATGE